MKTILYVICSCCRISAFRPTLHTPRTLDSLAAIIASLRDMLLQKLLSGELRVECVHESKYNNQHEHAPAFTAQH